MPEFQERTTDPEQLPEQLKERALVGLSKRTLLGLMRSGKYLSLTDLLDQTGQDGWESEVMRIHMLRRAAVEEVRSLVEYWRERQECSDTPVPPVEFTVEQGGQVRYLRIGQGTSYVPIFSKGLKRALEEYHGGSNFGPGKRHSLEVEVSELGAVEEEASILELLYGLKFEIQGVDRAAMVRARILEMISRGRLLLADEIQLGGKVRERLVAELGLAERTVDQQNEGVCLLYGFLEAKREKLEQEREGRGPKAKKKQPERYVEAVVAWINGDSTVELLAEKFGWEVKFVLAKIGQEVEAFGRSAEFREWSEG